MAIANVLPYRGEDAEVNLPRSWQVPVELVSEEAQGLGTGSAAHQGRDSTISAGWTDQLEDSGT